ncbi:hypothetical protein [Thermosipho affectus]|uniref:hypothetical protein n=1 Tax=Thermosipho affectus TaxID=660294 RepID=UPI00130143B5|nr:hypothetical protein [Thermosipho affectus]
MLVVATCYSDRRRDTVSFYFRIRTKYVSKALYIVTGVMKAGVARFAWKNYKP